MTPVDAVQQLASILLNGGSQPPSEDYIYEALAHAGVPDNVADRAYKFSLIACGRRFLDGMGVRFPNEYICFNRFGDVMESGCLADEPYFCAAIDHVGPEQIGGEAFGNFALLSADVQAVNNALRSGSDPANLVAAPAFLFLEPPTESGMVSAQQVIALHMKKLKADNPRRKPWWRFW
jgi:hypothetical protein